MLQKKCIRIEQFNLDNVLYIPMAFIGGITFQITESYGYVQYWEESGLGFHH